MPTQLSSQRPAAAPDLAWLALVQEKVSALEYGAVQIVIHDSRVVQVEATERHRFPVKIAAHGGE